MTDRDQDRAESESTRQLAAAFYDDLRGVARGVRGVFRRVGADNPTLQTTALIHEAYLKLYQSGHWTDREHFMNAAAAAMRQALIDHARARLTLKRGGEHEIVSLEEGDDVLAVPEEALLELNAAVDRLGQLDARLARVVECRYFAGYTTEETAAAMGVTERTVQRDWARARTWLFRELKPD
jgi:RNA polymerase sigma factor (TIGR02999 family)